jgi:Na+/H+-translocating membrane pyrophosphatase
MIVGAALGLSMSIGGGALKNAKKWIESYCENGDNTEVAYKAAVVGDTVATYLRMFQTLQ